ncbi:flagellar hook-length control protein FliK [Paenibacillus sp. 1_12]|uniref:flagellar hook-length control protein FliK n=1 Tax=Paenibacillus sp. 1_12 TaxID=1566278 RepID=UPI0008EA0392|nr:flagellar hook-length control protein FliK [Paenibacillus sp. 1_12]SFL46251.1 flagellar hook-length control protein FliK [Paenibacillus sp. 1_12]
MVIQAQTQIPVTTTGSSSTTSSTSGGLGSSTSNPMASQTTGGFSSTLNGLLSTAAPAGNALSNQAALTGMNVLVQLLGSVNNESVAMNNDNVEVFSQQLDALLNLLGSDSEDAAALLVNPDIQAWLAGLQALLLQTPVDTDLTPSEALVSEEETVAATLELTDANNSADNNSLAGTQLNPLLFIPIESSSPTTEVTNQTPVKSNKLIVKDEALKLLESVNELLKTNGEKSVSPQVEKALQSALNDLQKLMTTLVQQPTAAQVNNVNLSEQAVNNDTAASIVTEKPAARVIGNNPTSVRNSASRSAKTEEAFPVIIPTANSKLEYLAAKSVQPKLIVDSHGSESPLFEPLVDLPNDPSNETPAIPMHEFLKHVQPTQSLTKPPVILMQAPSFVEDMTQLVIKSFTLDTKQDGFTEAKLSLYPQNLGQVDVKLTMHNGLLVAQFMADSSLGKEMLESQLSQLRTTLQSQGIQVEKIEVSQNQAFQSGMFQEQRQQQSQQSSKQQKGNGIDNTSFLDEEAIENEGQANSTSNGPGSTSIDITA